MPAVWQFAAVAMLVDVVADHADVDCRNGLEVSDWTLHQGISLPERTLLEEKSLSTKIQWCVSF